MRRLHSNDRLEVMFKSCPELEAVEVSDEWIDELWQRLVTTTTPV